MNAGMVNASENTLLVIVGDPANVETILEVPEDPFELMMNGSDYMTAKPLV